MVGLCHVRYFFTGRERGEVGTISVPARLRGDECRSYLKDVLQVKHMFFLKKRMPNAE
jgi:hypothetical protein